MFFWKASTVLDLMRQHQPKTATLLAGLPAVDAKRFSKKLAEAYPLCENISIDYAIIEKAKAVVGLALDDIGWNDVGSWEAVYDLAGKDANGNASRRRTDCRKQPRQLCGCAEAGGVGGRGESGDCGHSGRALGSEPQQRTGCEQDSEAAGRGQARRIVVG